MTSWSKSWVGSRSRNRNWRKWSRFKLDRSARHPAACTKCSWFPRRQWSRLCYVQLLQGWESYLECLKWCWGFSEQASPWQRFHRDHFTTTVDRSFCRGSQSSSLIVVSWGGIESKCLHTYPLRTIRRKQACCRESKEFGSHQWPGWK